MKRSVGLRSFEEACEVVDEALCVHVWRHTADLRKQQRQWCNGSKEFKSVTHSTQQHSTAQHSTRAGI